MLAFHLFWIDFSQLYEYSRKTPSHCFTNEKGFFTADSILAKIMTTKEVSEDPSNSDRKGLGINIF
jgi:hypothetical protein